MRWIPSSVIFVMFCRRPSSRSMSEQISGTVFGPCVDGLIQDVLAQICSSSIGGKSKDDMNGVNLGLRHTWVQGTPNRPEYHVCNGVLQTCPTYWGLTLIEGIVAAGPPIPRRKLKLHFPSSPLFFYNKSVTIIQAPIYVITAG
ncbi:hypothetical protein A0H81_13635 [Grifola frondosa]|uniref:Uncharacterized protein n=1 Tax=Grifola frondosa TaxID=5627 RepID=A0A1C7LNN3_GRIFR|nr:hypothetical protein A0H81_13635 [Grifola frondosa]